MAEITNRFLKTYSPLKNTVQIPKANVEYAFPTDYIISINELMGLSDYPLSFLAYDIQPPTVTPTVDFYQIRVFSEDTTKYYTERCAELKKVYMECHEWWVYPIIDDYRGLKEAYIHKKSYKNYELKNNDNDYFFVVEEPCSKDSCSTRHYMTFIDNTLVDVLINRGEGSPSEIPQSDALFAKLQIITSKDY